MSEQGIVQTEHSVQRSLEVYERARQLIPGTTQLLSRRPTRAALGVSPIYAERAKGCRIWDIDGNEYVDWMSAVGPIILGYADEVVDRAVQEQIARGSIYSIVHENAVELAEELVRLVPSAEMVRYAKGGGEACTVAVRIARGVSGKDKVLFCGYHGWHDWYLAANLGVETSLDGHLLPGLEPKGVPSNLKDTTLSFNYNDFDSLQMLVRNHDIGVIKMEVSRSMQPKEGFLEAIRNLATEKNIVLIFDECTSGFRETFGGLYKKYGVEPDMMMLGKTLGNGYAITTVMGRREIMKAAEDTFISSTFWTERIGSAAALKTLEVMEREKSWEKITDMGKSIGQRWYALAEKYKLPIEIGGLPALVNFTFSVKDWLKYKTLITQEMINQFADVTGDHQWIHIDVDRAKKESPFGQTVAHGYPTVSLVPVLLPQILEIGGSAAVINYGIDKLRLPAPVPAEARIRLKAELKNVRDLQGGGARVSISFQFEVEGGGKPACTGDVVYVYFP